jgi:hypothetical protein
MLYSSVVNIPPSWNWEPVRLKGVHVELGVVKDDRRVRDPQVVERLGDRPPPLTGVERPASGGVTELHEAGEVRAPPIKALRFGVNSDGPGTGVQPVKEVGGVGSVLNEVQGQVRERERFAQCPRFFLGHIMLADQSRRNLPPHRGHGVDGGAGSSVLTT